MDCHEDDEDAIIALEAGFPEDDKFTIVPSDSVQTLRHWAAVGIGFEYQSCRLQRNGRPAKGLAIAASNKDGSRELVILNFPADSELDFEDYGFREPEFSAAEIAKFLLAAALDPVRLVRRERLRASIEVEAAIDYDNSGDDLLAAINQTFSRT